MIKHLISLFILLALAATVRFYKLNTPLADWHSWRQADTASVSYMYATGKAEVLIPRYHDLSNIPSGLENPEGYRMVEFPLYNLIHAGLFNLLNSSIPLGFEAWGRVVSIAMSLISLVSLYFIVSHLAGFFPALASAFIFAVLPFNIFYSRTILPEPTMLALVLSGTYFFIRALDQKGRFYYLYLLIASLLLSASLLVKPYAAFYFLPLVYLTFKRFGLRLIRPELIVAALIVISPLLLWRWWIGQFPAGIPASDWLYNQNGIRFRPAWFRWLFAERLSKLILGYWGLLPFALGLLSLPKISHRWFFHLWLLGILAYLAVFAGGNVTHDYYQSITTPVVSVIVGLGLVALFDKTYTRFISIPLAFFSLAMMLFMGWYQIRGLYQINNPSIVEAGRFVDQNTPKDAKVIAPYTGDTAFLYQTKRSGWPEITSSLDDLISKGASYYVSVNYDQKTNDVLNRGFTVVEKNPSFVVVKLK